MGVISCKAVNINPSRYICGVRKDSIKKICEERIAVLFNEAQRTFAYHPERSKRYMQLVFAIVHKNKVKLTKEQKLSFCRKCFFFWRPGKSVSIDFDNKNKRIMYKCNSCGYVRKIKYK
ncbi:MAG: hypothetical protein AB1391_02860 [Candidatus Micrarchaeota archaeon]